MKFTCPTCGMALERELMVIIPHTEKHIIDAVKKNHPDWTEADGLCRKCYDYYKKEMKQG